MNVLIQCRGKWQYHTGRYIIAYDPSSVNGRTMTPTSLLEKSESVLEQHAIPVSRMQEVFGGEPGGFIATFTEANGGIKKRYFDQRN